MKVDVIHNCDIMEGFRRLDDKSIDCVITSPPYWQLRDYGFDGQWGLEPTFQEYLEHLWMMMEEIHRVLKDTGTVFINLGDTYSTKSGGLERPEDAKGSRSVEYLRGMTINQPDDLPIKNLLMIPHRFAIGCYDRGWTIRNDIIWASKNKMPEPVRDRWSKKHEYIFFMTKKPTKYYFDLDAIRESHESNFQNSLGTGKNPGDVSDFWNIPIRGQKSDHLAAYSSDVIDRPILAGCPENGVVLDPFSGTGTTLVRSMQLNRRYIGFEASEQFYKIADKNTTQEKNKATLTQFLGC
jgi:DNA modification methylase